MSPVEVNQKVEEEGTSVERGGELLFCGATCWDIVGRRKGALEGNLVSPTRLRPLVGVDIRFVASGCGNFQFISLSPYIYIYRYIICRTFLLIDTFFLCFYLKIFHVETLFCMFNLFRLRNSNACLIGCCAYQIFVYLLHSVGVLGFCSCFFQTL